MSISRSPLLPLQALAGLFIAIAACAYTACSNSERIVDSFDIWENAKQGPCTDDDEIFNREDSTYYKCVNGKWQINTEEWVQRPITERFLPIEPRKFIPNANFNTPFALHPPQPLHNGSVRCTFDGSEPNYDSSIIQDNWIIDTTTVVRCTEFVGEVAIQKQTETYFINESIHMPVVSISVAPDYVSEYLDAEPCEPQPCKNAKFWEDVEFPAHIEYFEKGNSSKEKAFEIDAGISIAGNWSRNQQKKSVAVIMRNEYQKGRINYPIFDTRPQNKVFKAFILRNNGQRFVSDYIGDALATSLLEGTKVDYQRSKQVVVFYNGQYRGIYDMREKINEHFFETNYNLDSKSINLVKHEANSIHLQNGSTTSYFNMLQFISKNDFKENNQAYDSVLKMIDIANYMEYMASEIYFRNGDWPHTNVRAWSYNNNPWKFVLYDVDQGLDWVWGKDDAPPERTNMFNRILNGGQKDGICATTPDYKCFHNIFKKLVQNPIFKQKFINRSAYLYSTFINQDQIIKNVDLINNSIENKQIERDMAIYKRPKRYNFCNETFDPFGECLKKWSKERDKTVRDDFRTFFNLDEDISIGINIIGNGLLKLDDMDIASSQSYNWTVFKHLPIQISIECISSTTFDSWNDGLKEPSRIISPDRNAEYTAICR